MLWVALLLREAALLRIALLLRETALLLWEAALLRIALLLRETALLRITLLGIALLLWITSLLLSRIKSRETACTLLLSIIWLLIEEVEVFTLLLSIIASRFVTGEWISSIHIEAVCKIGRSTKLRSWRL